MAFTDQEIASNVDKLVAAGAPRDDIEKFVSSAKAAQSMGPTPTQVANLPAPANSLAQEREKMLAGRPAALRGAMGALATPAPFAMNPSGAMSDDTAAAGPLADMGAEAAGATIGQIGGGAILGPAGIPIGGAAGGMAGNALAQTRRLLTGAQDKPNLGQFFSAGVSGAIPGVSQGQGLVQFAKAAGAYGGGNILAKATETGINQHRAPTWGEAAEAMGGGVLGAAGQKLLGSFRQGNLTPRETLDSEALANFQALRERGIVTPPMELGLGSDAVSSVGKKAASNQQASKMNELGWQEMAREDLGLSGVKPFKPGLPPTVDSKGAPIPGTPSTFDEVRAGAYKPYEELAAISPKTATDLDMLRQQNRSVQDAYTQFKNAKISREEYDRVKNTRDALESALQQKATNVGRPDLVPEMLAAKKTIAQSYAIENATNMGTGKVDPHALAKQLADGVPLTDNIRRIALYAQAFPRSSVTGAPASGVDGLSLMSVGNSFGQDTPSGKIMGTLQFTGGPLARRYQLSDFAQNRYATPALPDNQTDESIASALARFSAQQQTRK